MSVIARTHPLLARSRQPTTDRRVKSFRDSHGLETSAPKLELSLVQNIEDIGEESWQRCSGTNPFLSYQFLHALEKSSSVADFTGWHPQHVLVRRLDGAGESTDVVAVCPMYLKGHSYGEYVFDQSWAEAYDMSVGASYYPKLQSCVPFTPVTGSRVLIDKDCGVSERVLFESVTDTLQTLPRRMGVSSPHFTFNTGDESRLMRDRGWIQRTGVQYHWKNNGYDSFDSFLSDLKQSKRKSIRQERKRVHKNVSVRWLTGNDLKDPKLWDCFYRFYLDTVDKRYGTAYLTRDFFDIISETMAERILLVAAYSKDGDDDYPIAAALNFVGEDVLYGRNWGCKPGLEMHGLHFELCYYQAIEFCIEKRFAVHEAGAQGEHKVKRGYLPVETYSSHFIDHPDFSVAVKDFCRREQRGIRQYIESMEVHENPMKPTNKHGTSV